MIKGLVKNLPWGDKIKNCTKTCGHKILICPVPFWKSWEKIIFLRPEGSKQKREFWSEFDYNPTRHIKKLYDKKNVEWLSQKSLDKSKMYCIVTSAQSCNKVGHLFWFTILVQHETDDVILHIHSVHKHRGNSFKLQNYKMRLKQIILNWIDSMQLKKILFTNVFFSWSLCLLDKF